MSNLSFMQIILRAVLHVRVHYLSLLVSLLSMSGRLVKMYPMANVFFSALPGLFVGL